MLLTSNDLGSLTGDTYRDLMQGFIIVSQKVEHMDKYGVIVDKKCIVVFVGNRYKFSNNYFYKKRKGQRIKYSPGSIMYLK